MNTEETKTSQLAQQEPEEPQPVDYSKLVEDALPFLGVFPEPVRKLLQAGANLYFDYYSKKLEWTEYQITKIAAELNEAETSQEEEEDE